MQLFDLTKNVMNKTHNLMGYKDNCCLSPDKIWKTKYEYIIKNNISMDNEYIILGQTNFFFPRSLSYLMNPYFWNISEYFLKMFNKMQ